MEESNRLFKGFLRLLLSNLRQMEKENAPQKKNVMLKDIIEDLQRTLED